MMDTMLQADHSVVKLVCDTKELACYSYAGKAKVPQTMNLSQITNMCLTW